MKRRRVDLSDDEEFVIEVEGVGSIPFGEFLTIAESRNFPANIYEALLKSFDGRYFRLTQVSDDEEPSADGSITKGWYVAVQLDEVSAVALGTRWGVDSDAVLFGKGPETAH